MSLRTRKQPGDVQVALDMDANKIAIKEEKAPKVKRSGNE
jgi:hypothetical protein